MCLCVVILLIFYVTILYGEIKYGNASTSVLPTILAVCCHCIAQVAWALISLSVAIYMCIQYCIIEVLCHCCQRTVLLSPCVVNYKKQCAASGFNFFFVLPSVWYAHPPAVASCVARTFPCCCQLCGAHIPLLLPAMWRAHPPAVASCVTRTIPPLLPAVWRAHPPLLPAV